MGDWHRVEIERDGKTFAGKYRVEGGIITVTYDGDGGGDQAARVGNAEHGSLAKRMLLDVVSELRKEKPSSS